MAERLWSLWVSAVKLNRQWERITDMGNHTAGKAMGVAANGYGMSGSCSVTPMDASERNRVGYKPDPGPWMSSTLAASLSGAGMQAMLCLAVSC